MILKRFTGRIRGRGIGFDKPKSKAGRLTRRLNYGIVLSQVRKGTTSRANKFDKSKRRSDKMSRTKAKDKYQNAVKQYNDWTRKNTGKGLIVPMHIIKELDAGRKAVMMEA